MTAAPHVWDKAQVSRDGYIDECSDIMFAKGRASKFILHDPNFHHPFQNMESDRKSSTIPCLDLNIELDSAALVLVSSPHID